MTNLANIQEDDSIQRPLPTEQSDIIRTFHPGFEGIRENSFVLTRDYLIHVVSIKGFENLSITTDRNDKQILDSSKSIVYYRKYYTVEDYDAGIECYARTDSAPSSYNFGAFAQNFIGYKSMLFETYEQLRYYIDTENIDVDAIAIIDTETTGTELVGRASKELFQSKLDIVRDKQYQIERIQAGHDYRVRVMTQKMNAIRHKMEERLGIMKREVEKLEDFIWTIELYLGVHERVITLQTGATSDATILFMQKVLYMDVEYGVPGEKSIDFTNIRQFDEWLIKDKHYELFTTERCIRVFRVRKDDKTYNKNPMINSMMNRDNHKTYFLIRNGENVYRVYADIVINKLFPDQDEFLRMQSNVDNDKYYRPKKEDEIEDAFRQYHKQIIALQGLAFRTHIFDQLPEDFNLLDARIHDSGLVKFMYAANELVAEIRPSFSEWMKEVNSRAHVGNRIIWLNHVHNSIDYWRFSERFYSWNRPCEHANVPCPPERGVMLWIDYEGEIGSHAGYGTMMKNRKHWNWDNEDNGNTRWFFTSYDTWINYDACTLNDIQYYLNSRHERENYMQYFPILLDIEKQLIIDKKAQDDFATMIKGVLPNVEEWRIFQAIEWWKQKNKWKRSLQSDDCQHEAKAFRMIIKFLRK